MTLLRLCSKDQIKDNYFPAVCEKCGFKGCSCEWEGGGQIADTGDYSDATCPKCGEPSCEEISNEFRPSEMPCSEVYEQGWKDANIAWLEVYDKSKEMAKVWGEKIYTQEDMDYAIEKAKREVRAELKL